MFFALLFISELGCASDVCFQLNQLGLYVCNRNYQSHIPFSKNFVKNVYSLNTKKICFGFCRNQEVCDCHYLSKCIVCQISVFFCVKSRRLCQGHLSIKVYFISGFPIKRNKLPIVLKDWKYLITVYEYSKLSREPVYSFSAIGSNFRLSQLF